MNFNLVYNEILVLFLIILVGFILRKNNQISEDLNKGLSNLLINVTLPALIITSMHIEIDSNVIANMKIISLITIGIYIFTTFLGNILTRVLPIPVDKKNIFIFMIIFGNVGYMGYPVLGVLYPEYGIFYGLFNNIAFNIMLWTYGIYLFTSTQGEKYKIKWKLLLNHGIIAIIIGFFLLLTGIRLPGPVIGALDHLGEMTFPLSMLIIGSSLAAIRIRNIITNKLVFFLTFIKILFVPGTVLLMLSFFEIPAIVANVSILLTAMPCAANSVVFAEKFDRDHQFAAQGVFVSTMLAAATIPLFLYLLS